MQEKIRTICGHPPDGAAIAVSIIENKPLRSAEHPAVIVKEVRRTWMTGGHQA